MDPMIFIKFCGLVVHSNPKNMALSAFPEKILVTGKSIFLFSIYRLTKRLNKLTNLVQIRLRAILQLSPARPFHFRPTLKIKAVHAINKKRTEWQTWNFTNMISCYCCYVFKSEREIVKEVLLSVIWNLLLIQINRFGIRILYMKREKVCAVCPYLLFTLQLRVTLRKLQPENLIQPECSAWETPTLRYSSDTSVI